MHVRNNIFTFENLTRYPAIAHAISTKDSGSMKNPDGTINRTNLVAFQKTVGIVGEVVCMEQVHKAQVKVVEDTKVLRIADVDGVVTDKKHVGLGVVTADCLPILVYDPVRQVIGAIHAGSRGLMHHVIEETLAVFVSKFGSQTTDFIVGIGPSIEKDCYEVNEEFARSFSAQFPTFTNIQTMRDEKYFLDMKATALQILYNTGVRKDAIEVSSICTLCDGKFYSFRRGDKTDRFVSMISLV